MSRPLRLEFAGALYHITSRGNERKLIYFQEDDFDLFLTLLGKVCKQYNWKIHAYCLMNNHYHLMLETLKGNLSKGMRQLNGIFTQSINHKHHRVGHLFQGRFKSILVDKDPYLLELARYIVLNPVRAHIVDSPEKWLWSSWHYTVSKKTTPSWMMVDFLLSQFSSNRSEAIKKYIIFVSEGLGVDIWSHLKHQIFLGDDEFVEKYQILQEMLAGDLKEVPLQQRIATPLTLNEYQKNFLYRDEAILKAYKSGSYTLKEIGDHFGLHYSRISRIVKKNKT